jgi:hypothetical protein
LYGPRWLPKSRRRLSVPARVGVTPGMGGVDAARGTP